MNLQELELVLQLLNKYEVNQLVITNKDVTYNITKQFHNVISNTPTKTVNTVTNDDEELLFYSSNS